MRANVPVLLRSILMFVVEPQLEPIILSPSRQSNSKYQLLALVTDTDIAANLMKSIRRLAA